MGIHFICLNSGNYLGRGKEYVTILRDMIFRNLPEETSAKFTVFTDDPDEYPGTHKAPLPHKLNGWFNKLALFKKGLFPDDETVIYFDLDTVITGPLDDIINYKGKFATLRDFYRGGGLQSSVMIWNGDNSHVWETYVKEGYPEVPGGDQAWIENFKADVLQDLFPKRFVSYKVHAMKAFPKGASVCVFHGLPRPHEVKGWVESFWRIGGATALEFFNQANTEEDQLIRNIEYSTKLGLAEISVHEAHADHAVIVGGGPSVRGFVDELKWRKAQGQKIFALNNSHAWLKSQGIQPDFHIMLDARPENASFVPDDETVCYYSSQCDKAVFDKKAPILWNHVNATSLVDGGVFIGGGSTVGLNAMALAAVLGYREMHLYGFDSSYDDDRHHAYEQALNDAERTITVTVGTEHFHTAPWMAEQASQFVDLVPQLISMGCVVTVHGEGLLPYMAAHYSAPPPTAADLRAEAILSRLEGIETPLGVEVGVFKGDLSKRLLAREGMHLYMVDSWKGHDPESEYAKTDFHGQLSQADQDRFCEYTKDVTRFAGNRGCVLRHGSIEASELFADEMFDFVFLDADHTYEGIKADIQAWMPKVKPGGILSGHDYDNIDFPAWGVKQAVDEIGLPVDLGLNFTWFVRKNI